MHCIISLFWFLYNHVTSPAKGLHFSALVLYVAAVPQNISHRTCSSKDNVPFPFWQQRFSKFITQAFIQKKLTEGGKKIGGDEAIIYLGGSGGMPSQVVFRSHLVHS